MADPQQGETLGIPSWLLGNSPVAPNYVMQDAQNPPMATPPPTTPAPSGMQDAMTQLAQEGIASSQMGRQVMAEQIARMRGMTDEMGQLRSQQAGLTGHLAYQPHFAPMTGQGVGHDLLNVLGNIGKGVAAFGASTAPGQAVQNVLYSEPRRQYANIAQQIQDIQKGIEGEKEIVPSAASMSSRALYPVAAAGRSQAELMNADTRRIVDMKRNDLKEAALQIQQEYNRGRLTNEQAATQMRQVTAKITADAIKQSASTHAGATLGAEEQRAVEQEINNEAEHYIQTFFGVIPKSNLPTKPGQAAAPTKPTKPAGTKATHIWTPQGLQPAGKQ